MLDPSSIGSDTESAKMLKLKVVKSVPGTPSLGQLSPNDFLDSVLQDIRTNGDGEE